GLGPGRSLAAEGFRYHTTWDTEGSQTRRTVSTWPCGGTTTRGVVPGRCMAMWTLSDSGAGTAFPVLRDGPSARAAQRRPGAERHELALPLRHSLRRGKASGLVVPPGPRPGKERKPERKWGKELGGKELGTAYFIANLWPVIHAIPIFS